MDIADCPAKQVPFELHSTIRNGSDARRDARLRRQNRSRCGDCPMDPDTAAHCDSQAHFSAPTYATPILVPISRQAPT